MSNIEARQDTTNLWSTHCCIQHSLELQYFIFAHIFAQCSSSWTPAGHRLEPQKFDRKWRTKNLKFRTDLKDRKHMVFDYFPRQIAQKIFESKLEAHLKHHSFPTDSAATFECNQFRLMPGIVSKLLLATIWSGCPVKLEPEQTPCSWTSCRFKSWNRLICSYGLFSLRDQLMIEKFSKAMSGVLVCYKFLPTLLRLAFHMKKTVVRNSSLLKIWEAYNLFDPLPESVSQKW